MGQEETSVLQWCGLSIAVAGMLGFSHIRRERVDVAVAGIARIGFEVVLTDDEIGNGKGLELPENLVKQDRVDPVIDDQPTTPSERSEAAAAESAAEGMAPTLVPPPLAAPAVTAGTLAQTISAVEAPKATGA